MSSRKWNWTRLASLLVQRTLAFAMAKTPTSLPSKRNKKLILRSSFSCSMKQTTSIPMVKRRRRSLQCSIKERTFLPAEICLRGFPESSAGRSSSIGSMGACRICFFLVVLLPERLSISKIYVLSMFVCLFCSILNKKISPLKLFSMDGSP